jgi:hypothetical protein
MVALRTDAAAFARQDQSDRRSLIEAPSGIWHKETAAFQSREILARSTVMSSIAGPMSGAQWPCDVTSHCTASLHMDLLTISAANSVQRFLAWCDEQILNNPREKCDKVVAGYTPWAESLRDIGARNHSRALSIKRAKIFTLPYPDFCVGL